MGAAELSLPASGRESAHGGQSLSLISAARIQKFDLLSHLAVNLAQPIVVCGPEGIGKTTFLRLLKTRLAPLATVCYLTSAPGVSFERIVDELSRALNQEKSRSASSGADLTDLLESYAKERRNVVLLLDDAGALVSGLLDALWQLAGRYPSLCLVFAMRTEEMPQKSDTDKSALGDAFILEIPALSEEECGLFADQLRVTLPVLVTEHGITESFVKRLHARSRGIPGKVIEILGSPYGSATAAISTKVGWLTGAGLLVGATAYAFFLMFSRQIPEPDQQIYDGPVVQNPEMVSVVSPDSEKAQAVQPPNLDEPLTDPQSSSVPLPLAESEKSESLPIRESVEMAATRTFEAEAKKTVEAHKPIEPDTQREPLPPSVMEEPKSMSEAQIEMSPDRLPPAGAVTEAEAKRGQSGAQESERSRSPEIVMEGLKSAEWLMNQSPEAYTLQIVAVSRLNAVRKLAKQFPPGSELASFRSRKGSSDLYPLFFGIYPTLPAAKEATATLPLSVGQPLPRQMKSIHQEIRRMMPRHAELSSSVDSSAR